MMAPPSPSVGISMTISIDAKCYYVLVFIRSCSTWGPLSQGLWFSAITSVDSAEVIYAMALLTSFCFSAAFQFELVSMLRGTKMYFSFYFFLCAFG